MKKVCFDIQSLVKEKTGIGWYTNKIINNIEHDDIRMAGMCFDFLGRNKVVSKFEDIKVENIYINKYIPSKVYKLLTGYLPINYDWFFPKGDIYHFFNFVAPSISKKKKVIITVHDMVYKVFPETVNRKTLFMLNRDLKRSIDRADAIITVSQHSKKDLMKYHDVEENKISIVPPGIEYDFYKGGQDVSSETQQEMQKKFDLPDKYILYLGTIEPRKNISSLIDAFMFLPEEIRNEYKLVIAGGVGWKAKSIVDKVSNHQFSDRIILTGYVDEVDKPYLYGMASVFVFPSLYEGFGMPIIEAMACGTAVVTANNSSLPEAGGEAALYSDALDIRRISENIKSIIVDDSIRDECVQKGIKHAQRFSWEDSAKKTVKVYEELLGDI